MLRPRNSQENAVQTFHIVRVYPSRYLLGQTDRQIRIHTEVHTLRMNFTATVISPAGILLVIHGHHKGVALTLCLGVLILVFCSCCLPASYVWIRRCKKRRRQRELAARALHSATKEKAAFENAATTDDHPRDDAENNYVNT